MDNEALALKAAAATFFGMIGAVAGWKSIMLLLLVAAMLLDYVSGSLAAARRGEWSSAAAREGLFHKGGIVFAVLAAIVADGMIEVAVPTLPIAGGVRNPGLLLPLVLSWYIITEVGSVLENAAKMGAQTPKWFISATRNIKRQIDAAAGDAADPDKRGADE